MSTQTPASRPGDADVHPAVPDSVPAPPEPVALHYAQTPSFVELLTKLGASLVVSTYQANKRLTVRAQGAGLSTLVRTYDRRADKDCCVVE